MEKELQKVNYEQARRLRAAGFDWKCDYYYPANSGEIVIFRNIVNDSGDDRYFTAPTVALVLKWMRDVKGIVNIVGYHDGWYGAFQTGTHYFTEWHETDRYGAYEAAESALLDELLSLLEKNQSNETGI